MDQAIQDSVGQCWITDDPMPVVHGELSGHNSRAQAMAVFEDFQEIMALLIGEFGQAPVVEDQQIGFGEANKEFSVAAVCLGNV